MLLLDCHLWSKCYIHCVSHNCSLFILLFVSQRVLAILIIYLCMPTLIGVYIIIIIIIIIIINTHVCDCA